MARRRLNYPSVATVAAAGIEAIVQEAITTLVRASHAALAESADLALKPMKTFNMNVTNGIDRRLPAALHEVGQKATASLIEAYDEMVVAREGPASRRHYRPGGGDKNRYSGGVLEEALRKYGIVVEGNSIGIADINRLNRSAQQWHRIAFGSTGEASVIRAPITFYGVTSGYLTLAEGASPRSKADFLPPGRWLTTGGQFIGPDPGRIGADEFYPGKSRYKSRWTRGVTAKNFFGPSLHQIANDLPLAVSAVIDDAVNEWWSRRPKDNPGTITIGG